MSNKDFSDQLQTKLNEALGFGFGAKNVPVQALSFPDSSNQMPIENNPANDQVIVTQGETKPIDEPREDIAAQNQACGQLNSEVVGEISSLLVSIGYILSKEGIVPDKFDTDAVITVLTKHFKPTTPVTQEPPTDAQPPVEQPPVSNAPVANLTYDNPMVNAYMESRKLLESRHAKNN